MHLIILSPLPECLSVEPEQDAKRAPQRGQAHVQHDRRDVAVRDDPWRYELAEAVAPQVLVDGDGDKYRARDRLVRVDGIGGSDTGDGGDLDARAGVANDDDDLVFVSR